MAYCNALVGVPKGCGDNNLGSVKRALIGSYEDLLTKTVTSTGVADTDGNVTAVTRTVGTKFEEFTFPKDTSSFAQELVLSTTADTHGYKQTLMMGFRRIDLRKRNAVSLLTAGRRDLVAVVEDFNGDWWMLGADQGLQVTADNESSNETRSAGQTAPVTLTSEYESHKWYKVDPAVALGLLVTAV